MVMIVAAPPLDDDVSVAGRSGRQFAGFRRSGA